MTEMIALLAFVAAVTLGCVFAGHRVRLLGLLGLDVAAALLVPSYAAWRGWFDPAATAMLGDWFRKLAVLDWFVVIVIAGSLTSVDLDRSVAMVKRAILPLLLGSFLGGGAGVLVGWLSGMSVHHTFFYLIAPAMAGGVTAGAMPLAAGYAQLTGVDIGQVLVRLLPAVAVANLLGVIAAGFTRALGGSDKSGSTRPISASTIADRSPVAPIWWIAALACLVVLRQASQFLGELIGLPPVVLMIPLVLLAQSIGLLVAPLRTALLDIYRWSVRWLTFPILVLVGLVILGWQMVAAGLSFATMACLAAMVLTLGATGALLARRAGTAFGDGAIILLSRVAMGGTGNIAMLRAARRIDLMPVANLATRLGGTATITVAIILMGQFKS